MIWDLCKRASLVVTIFFLFVSNTQAQTREMLLFIDIEPVIVSATKHPQLLRQSPAIATVITDKEIRSMGARDIVDVLNRVPGIHVTKGYYGKEEIEVRGIKTTNSEKVKMLIDGHSVNDNYSGGAVWGFDSLALDNVKRVEIIRGPGSALYGSNAFSAIINVVTKGGKDMDGVIITGGGGDFDTGKINLQAGKKFENLDMALSLDYFTTSAARLYIDSDVLGNSGYTKDFEDKFDAGLKMTYKDLTFNSKYVKRKKGTYLGVGYAVNDESEADIQQYFSELSYIIDLNEDVNLIGKAYIDSLEWDTYVELYPEGTLFPPSSPSGVIFPDGVIAGPGIKEKGLGLELQLDYKMSDKHFLTFGILGEESEQFEVIYIANFDPRDLTPLPSVQDVSSLANWNQEKTRRIWATYLQDVWDINEDINLTLGVRRDNYSDFGDTTNPRAALVWNILNDWDIKLLYGEAFRAPSFEELYNINNPAVLGNQNLKPEKIRTYEVSLDFTQKRTAAKISYFNNAFTDKIQLVPQPTPGLFVFDNTGGAKVYGVEAEIRRSFGKGTYSYLNYTFQRTRDEATGKRLADVPAHRGNIGASTALATYFNANLNIFLSGERPREQGDPRDSLPGYALVDLTIIAKAFYPGLEVRFAAKNLLDKKYVDPAPYTLDPAPAYTLEKDFPRKGINFMVEALYKF